MTNVGSPPDLSSENKISLIEEAVKVIYDLRSSAPHQPMRIMCGVLQSLEISLIKVKEEWERTEVGKLEATIQRLKERDLELRAVICHMADQLIGRVPIKPVESAKAKDALIVDLQANLNETRRELKATIDHVGKMSVERNDLQKANAKQDMLIKELREGNADLYSKAVPNSDLIKANAKLTKERDDLKARVGDDKIKELYRENTELRFLHNENTEINHLRKTNTDLVGKLEELRAENNDLRMQVEHLEGEVEPNEQIEKLTAELNDLRTKDDTEALAHAQEANTDLVKRVEELNKELYGLQDVKSHLVQEISRLKSRNIQHMHETIDNLRSERDRAIQAAHNLQRSVDELREYKKDLIKDRDRRDEDAQELWRQKEYATDQLELAKKELADRKVMIGDLKGKLDHMESTQNGATIKSLQDMVATRDRRIQDLLEENAELSGQVSNLQNLVARPDLGVPFIKSIDKIAKERDEARASNKALSSVGESMFEENEALRKINKELEEKRSEQKRRGQGLLEQNKELLTGIDNLRDELTARERVILEQNDKIN